MKKIIFLLVTLLLSVTTFAQRGTVSGIVKDPSGKGIPNATVRELDAQRRVVKHTKTDANGLFSFKVKDMQHSIQVVAADYRRLSHKMLGHSRLNITLEPRRKSPLAGNEKIILSSDLLFCGLSGGEQIKQWAWVEQLNDTVFTLILPVRTDTPIDEYPQGRTLTILSVFDRHLMQWENVIDAYPRLGQPGEIDPIVLAQSYTGTDNIPGVSRKNEAYFAYPHFQFTLSQLRLLASRPEQLQRLVVDTYSADNVWNFYPTNSTSQLLNELLAKVSKTHP